MHAIRRFTALLLSFLLLCSACLPKAIGMHALLGGGLVYAEEVADESIDYEEGPQATEPDTTPMVTDEGVAPEVTSLPEEDSPEESPEPPIITEENAEDSEHDEGEVPQESDEPEPTGTPEVTPPAGCVCCIHCLLCFTAEGLPVGESCACVDGEEVVCSCACFLEDTPACLDTACACGCAPCDMDATIASRALEHTDGGPIVFTFAELKQAIENGSAPVIYLGYGETNENGETKNNGVLSYAQGGGITVRRNIIINGTDPRNGKRVTLEDYGSLATDTLRVGVAGLTVHLRDMNVVGHNFFGIVYVPSLATNVVFTDVTYTGRQMVCAYGAGTSVSFTDCTVQIQNMDGNSGEEVVEAAEVRLYGNNTITRSASFSGATWSMFWLNASPYRVTVNGNAKLETNNYFIYDPSNNTQLSVHGVLNVKTSGNNGCMTNAAFYLNECTVAPGGALHISHNGSAYGSLRVRGLNVSGTLTVDKDNNTLPCVELTAGGSATFESPQYVRLTNPSGRLMHPASGTAAVRITTQVVNRWQGSGEPFVWNNRGLEAYTTLFSINSLGAVSGFSTTLFEGKGAAYGASQLTVASLDFYRSPQIAFGAYTLTIDDVYTGGKEVSGTAAGGTQTVFEYAYSGGTLGGQRQSAIAEGNYRAEFSEPMQGDSCIYVKSVVGGLQAHTYTFPLASCFFYEVPETLDFGTIPISARARMIKRLDPDWTISIKDTRDMGELWKLQANATPFLAENGTALEGMLVFVEDKSVYPLQGTDVRIATQPSEAWERVTDISFPVGEGLMLSLEALAGEPGVRYQSTITWTLQVGP